MPNLDYAFEPKRDGDDPEYKSYLNLMHHCKKMQTEIEEVIPPCAETTLAIRKLQEFAFWVDEAINVSGQRRELFPEIAPGQ